MRAAPARARFQMIMWSVWTLNIERRKAIMLILIYLFVDASAFCGKWNAAH